MLVKTITGTTIWILWQERNRRIFELEFCDKIKLKTRIEELIKITALGNKEKEIPSNWDLES